MSYLKKKYYDGFQIHKILNEELDNGKTIMRILSRFADEPSAQPDLDEWCTDCKEYDSEKHCCPRFNRVIRNALKDARSEIIRCGKCKHHEDEELGMVYCPIIVGGWVRDDWFCADAERKEQDDG